MQDAAEHFSWQGSCIGLHFTSVESQSGESDDDGQQQPPRRNSSARRPERSSGATERRAGRSAPTGRRAARRDPAPTAPDAGELLPLERSAVAPPALSAPR